jgi:hypothetical protein
MDYVDTLRLLRGRLGTLADAAKILGARDLEAAARGLAAELACVSDMPGFLRLSPHVKTDRLEAALHKRNLVAKNATAAQLISRSHTLAAAQERGDLQRKNGCDACGGRLEVDAASGKKICRECSATVHISEEDAPPAVRAETDHMKSSLEYLRKLQGHVVADISPDDTRRIEQQARQDRITSRNVSLGWYRSALSDLGLTHLNEAIPGLMQQIQRIQIPRLTENDEHVIAARMVRDNAIYHTIRSADGSKQRCNAIAYPYNAYRQIDLQFPPGNKKRLLLRLIHLQVAQTQQKHDDHAYLISEKDGRVFYALRPPPAEPFDAAP